MTSSIVARKDGATILRLMIIDNLMRCSKVFAATACYGHRVASLSGRTALTGFRHLRRALFICVCEQDQVNG